MLFRSGFSSGDFAARDGSTSATPVQLRFDITVNAADGTTLTTDYAVRTFVVRVRNLAKRTDVSGTANVEVETPTATSTAEADDTATTERSGTTTKQGATTTNRTNTTAEQSGTPTPESGDGAPDGADEGA